MAKVNDRGVFEEEDRAASHVPSTSCTHFDLTQHLSFLLKSVRSVSEERKAIGVGQAKWHAWATRDSDAALTGKRSLENTSG